MCENLASCQYWGMLVLLLWSLPWKGAALWKAAKNKSVVWFVVLFLVHTAGILDILYLFVFTKRPGKGKGKKKKTGRKKR